MTPSVKHAYIIALIALLALTAAIVGAAYVHAMVSAGKAEQIKADVQQQIAALQKDLKDGLAQTAKDKQVTQPQQIVQRLPQYIELPKPIILAQPATFPSPSGEARLPDAPSALVIPAESVTAFWQHEVSCKEDSLKLGVCEQSLPLMEKRAVAAEKALKGGGFFARVKANGKWMGIGAVAGLVISCATGHCPKF